MNCSLIYYGYWELASKYYPRIPVPTHASAAPLGDTNGRDRVWQRLEIQNIRLRQELGPSNQNNERKAPAQHHGGKASG